MSHRVVHVVAPSRLHFGMLSVGTDRGRHFGGVGVMLASPGLYLTIRPAERLETAGRLTRRTMWLARRAWRADPACPAPGGEPQCRIEVAHAPRQHVGLGTGTQLAMAVAAGMNLFLERPALSPVELARRVGRGERSSIGLYGFVHGGLLFEGGKSEADEISPLLGRVEMPEGWRFVLVCPRHGRGLSGTAERRAFATIPPVPPERSAMLYREAAEVLLPAASAGRFAEFGEGLYHFGYHAGLSFAARQGGPFAGPRLTSLVEQIRSLGVRGVGQSSWGPTLFALLPDPQAAEAFIGTLRAQPGNDDLDLTLAVPANRGARIELAS